MILYKNSLVKLEYNPANDILEVEHPNLQDFLVPEIKQSINIMVDNIKNYDVKKILLDSTNTIISVDDEDNKTITNYLALGLVKTRIQKLARIQSQNPAVESPANSNIEHNQETTSLPFQLQHFTDKAVAVAWLSTNT